MKKLTTFFLFSTALLLLFTTTGFSEPQQPDNLTAVSVHKIAGGFNQPVAIVSTGQPNDDRLFIVERTGKIRIWQDGVRLPTPFLNLEGNVSLEAERGLLGMVFDPSFDRNGYFYINYSDRRPATYGDTVVARFKISADINVADPSSQQIVLEVAQDKDNHNGGHLIFDLSGHMILGFGDGASPNDPFNRSQDKRSLLGKMVRISVNGTGLEPTNGCGRVRNYKIPADNPAANGENGWCPETISAGFRHPWRYSVDRSTGEFWIGDVGGNFYEEIDMMPQSATVVRNYGWPCLEGFGTPREGICELTGDSLKIDPIVTYERTAADGSFNGASVTGGYVYNGKLFPELQQHYFFADFVSGRIWAINKGSITVRQKVLDSGLMVSSFGEGEDGELYLADYATGSIYRLMGNHAAAVAISSPSIVKPEGEISWSIEIKNAGSQPLSNVTVRNQIPFGMVWQSGGSVESNQVVFDVGNLAAGETKIVEWTGDAPVFGGAVQNDEVSVTADSLSFTETSQALAVTIVADNFSAIFLPTVLR